MDVTPNNGPCSGGASIKPTDSAAPADATSPIPAQVAQTSPVNLAKPTCTTLFGWRPYSPCCGFEYGFQPKRCNRSQTWGATPGYGESRPSANRRISFLLGCYPSRVLPISGVAPRWARTAGGKPPSQLIFSKQVGSRCTRACNRLMSPLLAPLRYGPVLVFLGLVPFAWCGIILPEGAGSADEDV